ncbi:MAG: hypothetical protein JWO03_200 [Bacteroidetes bacterium]|nr:hypothetical protein [Bacteroidota bacterium]
MVEEIKQSFTNSKNSFSAHLDYPKKPGIYGFFLKNQSTLSDFGKGGQIIYIGISKDSLHDRDFNQHFKTGKTGSSTLRRSIGAILKTNLKLKAIPRGGENDSKRFDNYKFKSEQLLTDWMIANLEIGNWVPSIALTNSQLRDIEKQITIELKPSLDLDNRTKRFNPLFDKLNTLRKECKTEAGKK